MKKRIRQISFKHRKMIEYVNWNPRGPQAGEGGLYENRDMIEWGFTYD